MDGWTDRGTDRWTNNGQKVITIAHPEQSLGELKNNQEKTIKKKLTENF